MVELIISEIIETFDYVVLTYTSKCLFFFSAKSPNYFEVRE